MNIHLSFPHTLDFYRKNQKSVFMPVAILFVLLLLALFFIIPQVQLLLKVREDLREGKDRFSRLEAKKAQLQSTSAKLGTDFALSSLAIPSSKDIGLMLVTLDIIAQRSSVVLGNFTTSVGSLDDSTAKTGGSIAPSINMIISVKGETTTIRNFLKNLLISLPLLKIDSISQTKNSTSIVLTFFYKPIITTLPSVDSELPKLDKFQKTIDTLASRSAQLGLSIQQPSAEDQNLPQVPQLFQRSDPFF